MADICRLPSHKINLRKPSELTYVTRLLRKYNPMQRQKIGFFEQFLAQPNFQATAHQRSFIKPKVGKGSDQNFYAGAPISISAIPLSPKNGVPRGTRTPVSGVRGRCPRPLDDGDHSIPSFNAPTQFRQGHNDHRNNF